MAMFRALVSTLAAAGLPVVGVIALAWHGEAIAAWLGGLSEPVAIGVVLVAGTLLGGLALLPTHAVSLAAGFLLGGIVGPATAWIAIVAGAVLGYGWGGVVAGPGIAVRLSVSERWAPVYAAIVQASPARTAGLIALLRLSPLAPFAATNVALAAFRVPLVAFVVGAAIGLLPRVVIVAVLGAGLAELEWQSERGPWLLIIGGIATILALWLMGRIAARALRQATVPAA